MTSSSRCNALAPNIDTRFRNYAEFRAYIGWSPQVERSGSSLDSSKLARSGVRLSRKVPGQMVMIMLAPVIRTTASEPITSA